MNRCSQVSMGSESVVILGPLVLAHRAIRRVQGRQL